MPTLAQVLRELASELKDDAPGNEFRAFPREQLIQWLNDGVCLLGRLRPDLFARTRTVTLAPGSQQEVADCGVFGSVVAQVLPDGRETPVRRSSYTTGLQWRKAPCQADPNNYRISSFRFDPTQKTTFYVEPPVPPGKPVKAKIVCSDAPKPLSVMDLDEEFDIDCYQFAMVRHYVLSQAYAQDSDQTNMPLAQFHLNIWTGFIAATGRSDAAFAGGLIGAPPAPQGGQR